MWISFKIEFFLSLSKFFFIIIIFYIFSNMSQIIFVDHILQIINFSISITNSTSSIRSEIFELIIYVNFHNIFNIMQTRFHMLIQLHWITIKMQSVFLCVINHEFVNSQLKNFILCYFICGINLLKCRKEPALIS